MTLPFIHYLTDIVCHVTCLVVEMSPYDDILQYIYGVSLFSEEGSHLLIQQGNHEPSEVLMGFTKNEC